MTRSAYALVGVLGAIGGAIVGGFAVNQHWYKGTENFLNKRLEEDKLESDKNLGEKFTFMYITKMMNDRVQAAPGMSLKLKQEIQGLTDFAWHGITDEDKITTLTAVRKNMKKWDAEERAAS